jgi:cytoskeleton protein RodZ
MLEIGDSLREARGRQGLDLDEVEAATLIRARYLDALEHEQFEVLPTGAYRRSFLREYAGFLGLDGDLLVDEYQLRFEAEEPEPEPPPRRLPAWIEDIRLGRALAVVGAIAVFGIAVWQLGSTGGSGDHAPPAPALRATSPPKRHAATVPPSQPVVARTVPHTPPVLTLAAARGSCWLLVRIGSSSGQSVYEGTLQPGQSVRFGLRKRLWIRLGAPWNVEATIGKRVVHSLPTLTGDALATASGLTTTTT